LTHALFKTYETGVKLLVVVVIRAKSAPCSTVSVLDLMRRLLYDLKFLLATRL
jgi:hypothetical protein